MVEIILLQLTNMPVSNKLIGAILLSNEDYLKIDEDGRKIPVKYKVHLQPTNTQRLYLPSKELERGLGNMIHRSEKWNYNCLMHYMSP